MASLKYLSIFWKTLEMPFIKSENYLILTLYENCFKIDVTVNNQVPVFTITDTKLFIPVSTSSTEGNTKLLQQLKSSFKRTINWHKY